MPSGWSGKILEIDLGLQSYREVLIDPKIARSHLLGSGYAAWYFMKYLDAAADPMSPDACVLMLAGLVTGTPFPTACKMSVCGRSPLTGIWNESTVGGYFPKALKSTGYDGILLRGRSKNPIYLIIRGGHNIDFLDASHLWGLDAFETEERVRAEAGPESKVMCIGPAGERQVNIASIIFEGRNARTAGRGGMGAVLGYKNLKALAVSGDLEIPVFDADALNSAVRDISRELRESTKALHEYGTAGGMKNSESHGNLPVKNWREGSFEHEIDRVCGQEILRLTFDRHYSCFACPIGCGKIINVIHPVYGHMNSHAPEYEGAAGFSSLVMNADPYLVCAACEYCDRMGMDAISASSIVAFAMECFENGLLPADSTGGIKPSWGSPELVMSLLEKIAKADGIGKLLGKGVRRAAEEIGGTAAEYAIHVKGLEVPMHDPRAFYSMAANYATANRGACHLEALSHTLGYGRYYRDIGLPEKVPNDSASAASIAVIMQNFMAVFNPLGICKFLPRGGVSIGEFARWAKLATGIDFTAGELLRTGERLFNLKRIINARLGVSRKDDILPPRLFTKKRGSGRAADNLPDMGLILSDYYRIRGWNEIGIPTEKKLAELEIEFRT